MSNPCSCIGTVINTPPATPTPCPSGDCLVLCDIIVLATDGVGPCGQSGTIDVSDTEVYSHDLDACGEDAVTWSYVSKTGSIVSAVVTAAGVLVWITGGAETAGQYSTITLKACCGELSAYLTVIIGTKILCGCPTCEQCESCNPCTGLCDEEDIPLSIETITSNVNISIT